MKGYTLENINETLGSTKKIFSILEPDSDERILLGRIVDNEVDDGIGCIDFVVDSWRERLIDKRKKIWWKSMYEKDVASRKENTDKKEKVARENAVEENVCGEHDSGFTKLKELMEKGFQRLVDQVGEIDVKVDAKLGEIDSKVAEIKKVVLAQGKVFHGVTDFPKNMALTPYSRVPVTEPPPPRIVEITEPPPPRIVDITEEEEKKEKEEKEKKEKEEKQKKDQKKKNGDKKKSGLEIEKGQKRTRIATRKYTPEAKRSKKNV